ncbi:hypothetical protein [Spirillospora sp. NPDC047279]|uniref:hypothetical protein n=1 Tax=Spirillospora sp. NPDC047279 TaxID=3155478 RepID=UPI0034035F85
MTIIERVTSFADRVFDTLTTVRDATATLARGRELRSAEPRRAEAAAVRRPRPAHPRPRLHRPARPAARRTLVPRVVAVRPRRPPGQGGTFSGVASGVAAADVFVSSFECHLLPALKTAPATAFVTRPERPLKRTSTNRT